MSDTEREPVREQEENDTRRNDDDRHDDDRSHREHDERNDDGREENRGNDRRNDGGSRDKEMTSSLLVRNLSYHIRSSELKRIFSKCGEVRDVYIPEVKLF
jgi:RNA recognition motif-containing protein